MQRQLIPFMAIVGLLSCLLAVAAAHGQAVMVNTTTAGDQTQPTMAKAPNGMFFVVWQSDDDVSGSTNVLGRLLDIHGQPAGPETAIGVIQSSHQPRPSVAALTDNRFVVVWQGSSRADVRGRLINADGTADGDELILNDLDANVWPAVAADTLGGFAVVWSDSSNFYSQAFDGTGTQRADEVIIGDRVDINNNRHGGFNLVLLDNGEYLVVWETFSRILARRLDADAVPVAPHFRLNPDPVLQHRPVVAVEDGGVIVQWSERTDHHTDNYTFYTQRLANDGTFIGPRRTLNFDAESATVVKTASGFLAAYPFENRFLGRWQINAQPLDADGAPTGQAYRLSDDIALSPCLGIEFLYDILDRRIAMTDDGKLLVLWEVCSNEWDITVRRFPGFVLTGPVAGLGCTHTPLNADVEVAAVGSTEPVTLSVVGRPEYTFSPNPAIPGTTVNMTGPTLPASLERIDIEGDNGNDSDSVSASFFIYNYAPDLQRPANNETDAPIAPDLGWEIPSKPGINLWEVELAADPNFNTILDHAIVEERYDEDLWQVDYGLHRAPMLETNTEYYWRARVAEACGAPGEWVEASFTTAQDFVIASEWGEFYIGDHRTSTLTGTPKVAPITGKSANFVVTHPARYMRTDNSGTVEHKSLYAEIVGPTGTATRKIETLRLDGIQETDIETPATFMGDQEFLVVWGGSTDITSRAWGTDGVPLGTSEIIAGSPTRLTYPDVATNETSGEQVIVWSDRNGVVRIAGQRMGTNGTPLGNVFQVNSDSSTTDRPAISWSPVRQEFLVVWESGGGPGTDSDGWGIVGRRLASDGTPIANDFQINDFTTGDQRHPTVERLTGRDDFLVVWQSTASGQDDNDGWSIQGRRVADAGPIDTDFQINTVVTGDQKDPVLAVERKNGDIVVSWQSAVSPGDDSSGRSIVGRRLDPNASPAASDFQINLMGQGDQYGTEVAAHPEGGFLVVWRDASRVLGQPLESMIYFRDGFESGDTSAWSDAIGRASSVSNTQRGER